MSTLPLLALLANSAFGYSVKTDDAGNELFWATTPITISLNTEGMSDVSDDAAYEALEHAAGDFDETDGSELHFVVDGKAISALLLLDLLLNLILQVLDSALSSWRRRPFLPVVGAASLRPLPPLPLIAVFRVLLLLVLLQICVELLEPLLIVIDVLEPKVGLCLP